ncbi:hypothetical protein SEPCBS119000_006651 [Sporothrix epigloea]|uniref:Major facilitator superfamily (MFS) profile domain-containing protein n=1 Tax=Sporothrix epigloea TaxID=1892477 RepID=A0ABP0E431_9PEZI
MREPQADHNERQPLLHHEEQVAAERQEEDDREDDRTTSQRLAVAVPCLILLLCLEFGSVMVALPLNEILEGIICQSRFEDAIQPAADSRCKDTQVQAELASILGWYGTFSLVPGLFTGIAWGLAADRYGRKPVLVLANIGIALALGATMAVCRYPDIFPIRLVWLCCIFYGIGGGAATYNALIFTMASDISTQAQRSTAFFYLGSAATAGLLVAGPLTALIMNLAGAWSSVYCGLTLFLLTIPISIALPETRSKAVIKRMELANAAANDAAAGSTSWDIRGAWHAAVERLKVMVRILFIGNPTVGILLCSSLFTVVGQSVTAVLLQYATKRFGWAWSKAGLLITAKGLTTLVLTAVLLPLVSHLLLTKGGMVPLIKDWWIIRGSAVIGVLASLAMGLSPTSSLFVASLVFNSLGGGMYLVLRSMLTELVDPTHVALLMTASGLFLTISELISGPLLAQLFRLGLELGGVWLGLPFFASAAMLTVSAIMVFCVPIGRIARARSSSHAETDD